MQFTKMEGLGNDYIYLNGLEGLPEDLPGLAVRLSRPHFGVGADGLICIRPGRGGDFSMEMYNADGSRGAMCGNGIRCVGKYVYDKGLTRKTCLTIDTDAGPRTLTLFLAGGAVDRVEVDMGVAVLSPPVCLELDGEPVCIFPVSTGNPHAVLFCSDPAAVDLARLGPRLEVHPALSERSNIELARALSPKELEVRVWERGSGITLACGTGACAVFAAARSQGLCGPAAQVRLPGGVLSLEERGGHIFLTGPARTVFEGEIAL
ncbi:MAG: diaminopimelate epimerase [Lawsonibacter sp.]|nr:diaminopimelate epimerase [Lawsonibacter sp.]